MKIKRNLSNDCFENNLLGLLVYPRLNCSLNMAFDLSTYIVNTMPHGKSFVYGLETVVSMFVYKYTHALAAQ